VPIRPDSSNAANLKEAVHDFWNDKACGEIYAIGTDEVEALQLHANKRYELEPYIYSFARFDEGQGKDVLEIGVGMGTDHLEWAKSKPSSLAGIDLTPRAIAYTRARLQAAGYHSNLQVGDAESLGFSDQTFDLVYSWGVLHHTPNTAKAIDEVYRVLRPGGIARIMIYHKYSVVGDLLWFKYGLLAGKPHRTLKDIYAHHLESPGTQAFTVDEALSMFSDFTSVQVRTQLSFGDLLQGAVGQKHQSLLLALAKNLWPRLLIKAWFPHRGLALLIQARK
jgi:ubiquinone/menaquinone biosynthesis C-methylase UbiE